MDSSPRRIASPWLIAIKITPTTATQASARRTIGGSTAVRNQSDMWKSYSILPAPSSRQALDLRL